MAFADLEWGWDFEDRRRASQADAELPPLRASDGREEWARRVRGLCWLEGWNLGSPVPPRVSKLREECLDWIAAQGFDVDESEKLASQLFRIRWRTQGIFGDVVRHFAHPRLARFCLLAAALDEGQNLTEERPEPLLSVFAEFEAAAPLDVQRACSILEVNEALLRLGQRQHRRCMRIARPFLARAVEALATSVALDTREGMQQVDLALSFVLVHRHDLIAHRLIAFLEAREDPAAASREFARVLRWSLALSRCRVAGRIRDPEEFRRQLSRAIEQLSPPLSDIQRWRLARMRLRFVEPYLCTDAQAFGFAELWREYRALMPDASPRPVRIGEMGQLLRRKRLGVPRRAKSGEAESSNLNSPS